MGDYQMDTYSIIDKRALLFAARMRFSPQSRIIRDVALEKIIERQLFILDREGGITPREIMEQEDICLADGTIVTTRVDIDKSLERLDEKNKVTHFEESGEIRYRLTEEALQEYNESQRTAGELFTRVVSQLFKNTGEGPAVYQTPFLECLCIIFSQLGEFYVRVIKGDVDFDELLRSPIIKRALQTIENKYQNIDTSLFESALFSFFEDTDPDYDAIKWNMAQNYYIAKAIGLDPSGFLLSKEVFGNAAFYLDTNVIIQPLEPKARHHKSFQALSKACKSLEIHLKVCQISLDELNNVLEYQRELLEKVVDKIPNKTSSKIRSVFYKLYKEQLESEGHVDFKVLFDSFYNAMEELGQVYDVELVDDKWFDTAVNEQKTKELVEEIRRLYRLKRNRPKIPASALHDALLLRWLELERERSTKNTWLVTLDTSLPSYLPKQEKSPGQQLAITLDALIQWISPVGIYDSSDEDEVATIFSEAVKYQILPQEKLFDLRDFLVFAEMEWETKELPAEDVEECIRYIRQNAPDLDPNEASDREKIAYEISRFFADPGRKYKQEIEGLELRIDEITEERERVAKDFKKEVTKRDKEIQELKGGISRLQDDIEKDRIRQSAWIRLVISVVMFFGIEVGVIWLASKYGEGLNLFQKVIKSWPFIGLGAIIGLALSWVLLGKDRIRALGWAFTKLFKAE